jgi:transporter family-2 protein
MTLGGAMLAVQARVNGELGHRSGSALVAALISFGVGLVASVALISARGSWPAVMTLRRGERKLWWFSGGLCGALMVASVAAAVPAIGVALLSVCLVAGQLAGALVVDLIGLTPGLKRAVTSRRVLAAVLAVGAVFVSTVGQNATVRPVVIAWVTLAGFLASAQQAANAHIWRHADEILVSLLVNFVVGTAALAIVIGVQLIRHRLGDLTWPGAQLWLYSGGLMGAVFVLTTTAVVGMLGALRVTLAVVAGQLAGAVLVDVFWRSASRPTAQLYAGIVIVFVAVRIAGSRTRGPARPSGTVEHAPANTEPAR